MRIFLSKFLVIPSVLLLIVLTYGLVRNYQKDNSIKTDIQPTKIANREDSGSNTTQPTDEKTNNTLKEEITSQIVWNLYDTTTYPKTLNFSKYKLYYPSNWKLEERKYEDEESFGFTAKLYKTNGDYINIIQGAGGGGWCIFPDEPDFETFQGMGEKLTKYIEIKKINDVVWRLGESSTGFSHYLCELSKLDNGTWRFRDSPRIGFVQINVKTEKSLNELKEILTKLEIEK